MLEKYNLEYLCRKESKQAIAMVAGGYVIGFGLGVYLGLQQGKNSPVVDDDRGYFMAGALINAASGYLGAKRFFTDGSRVGKYISDFFGATFMIANSAGAGIASIYLGKKAGIFLGNTIL